MRNILIGIALVLFGVVVGVFTFGMDTSDFDSDNVVIVIKSPDIDSDSDVVEEVPKEPVPVPTPQQPIQCVIGGCSGTLCTNAADGPVASTCEYAAWYSCFKEEYAVCEVQQDGLCGWTENTELNQCIERRRSFDYLQPAI